MSEPPMPQRPDHAKENAARAEFVRIVKERTPVERLIEKGKFAGKSFQVDAVPKGPASFEYRGIVGKKRIATMEMRFPIGGLATVSSAKVAKDFRRSGVATQIYREINEDLAKVGAKLEPSWGAMTAGAVRFWQDFGSDDAEMQQRLAAILEEMEREGKVEEYDANGGIDDWNGDTIRKTRNKK